MMPPPRSTPRTSPFSLSAPATEAQAPISLLHSGESVAEIRSLILISRYERKHWLEDFYPNEAVSLAISNIASKC